MQKSPSASEDEESVEFGAYITQHHTDDEARDSIASITIKCPSNTKAGDTFGEEMKPSYRNSRVSLKTAALGTGGLSMKHRSIVDIYKESKQASSTNLTQGPKNSISARPSQTGVRISLTGVARPSQAGMRQSQTAIRMSNTNLGPRVHLKTIARLTAGMSNIHLSANNRRGSNVSIAGLTENAQRRGSILGRLKL
jgi:hypothetical protein